MANENCSHCGVLITDQSTVVRRDGKVFCCPNCATAAERAAAPPDAPRGPA
jgi:hypothetical protein